MGAGREDEGVTEFDDDIVNQLSIKLSAEDLFVIYQSLHEASLIGFLID